MRAVGQDVEGAREVGVETHAGIKFERAEKGVRYAAPYAGYQRVST